MTTDLDVLERVLARRGQTGSTRAQEPTETNVPDTPVTKLPEVHDPAGESLPFHVPAGRATQVMGTIEIDPARMPSELDPTVTDTKARALPILSSMARTRDRDEAVAELDELIQASKLGKLARKWGARVHVTVRVSR